MNENDLMTVGEVCRLLRIRPSTCYAAAEDGRLPHVLLWRGRRKRLLRFYRAEIEDLLRRGVPLEPKRG